MFTVTIDLDAYDRLPPRQLKGMLRALRFADADGVVHASLSMLAMPGLMSRSTVHRELVALEDAGQLDRQERPEGGFLWRIGRRFRCRSIPGPKSTRLSAPRDTINAKKPEISSNIGGCGTPVPTDETTVPQRGTTDSRADPRLELSSGSKEPSERELSAQRCANALSQQDEIPNGWEDSARAERRLAGLPEVNLRAEWRKLVAYSEGQRITIWRWRGWALKARAQNSQSKSSQDEKSFTEEAPDDTLPGDERQQRQARDWVRRGFWLRSGAWGPAPDQPGCELPPDLVAWCLRERAALAA